MKLFDNFRYRMQQWAYGRYGMDELGRFLYIIVFVLLVVSLIPYCSPVVLLSMALLFYNTFRACSRNVEKRKRENEWYLRKTAPMRERRQKSALIREEKRNYVFIRCRKCSNLNRVPRGKGKIRITCPKCGDQIVRKV